MDAKIFSESVFKSFCKDSGTYSIETLRRNREFECMLKEKLPSIIPYRVGDYYVKMNLGYDGSSDMHESDVEYIGIIKKIRYQHRIFFSGTPEVIAEAEMTGHKMNTDGKIGGRAFSGRVIISSGDTPCTFVKLMLARYIFAQELGAQRIKR